jgi:hypothetical protein
MKHSRATRETEPGEITGTSKSMRRALLITLFGFLVSHQTFLSAQEQTPTADKPSAVATATVGYPVVIKQVLLPGSELTGKPVESREAKVVLRVLGSFAHGDGFRYDLEMTGFEPGVHNLSESLIRKDATATADLPPVWVEITSQLPAGQVKPHQLPPTVPKVTGYYTGLMIAAAGLWSLGLLGILFWGRGKETHLSGKDRRPTVADRLRPLLERAAAGTLSDDERASLERVLLAFWRKKLRLEKLPPAQLFPQLRQHPEAAGLLRQMEQWLHAPGTSEGLHWQQLLEPYRTMDWTDLELP